MVSINIIHLVGRHCDPLIKHKHTTGKLYQKKIELCAFVYTFKMTSISINQCIRYCTICIVFHFTEITVEDIFEQTVLSNWDQ